MQRELITFQVSGQTFALDIMDIREIRAWTPTTRLPNAPPYVAGVVNLRGTVLPVIDLAARLGWDPVTATSRHAIIVLQTGNQLGGLIVDSVNDILTIADGSLQPVPATQGDSVTPFLEGLAAIDDKMVMVIAGAALLDQPVTAQAA